jgi:serine/threonine protein kinase/Flp pilus assembly protein TadD
MIGKTLGHYLIMEKIGAGGMGVVYRAHDEHLDRSVALKVLPPGALADETARSRFRREALTLSQLNHPNIAVVHDFDSENGVDFLTMEYVVGETLAAKIAAGPLPEKEVIALGTQIAEALEEAHEHGIIHRDLKSANVMVTPKGHVKVMDFGLAKLVPSVESDAVTADGLEQTQARTLLGTVPYMAPEVLQAQEADARSDLWALGVMLYEMATGTRPFQGQTYYELSSAILRDAPLPLPDNRPPGLRTVIERCLEKDPDKRYQLASEVRAALEAVRSAEATASPQRQRTLKPKKRRGRRKRIRSLAVLPLVNLSGDPEQEYFADGMTETLIADLAKLRALRIISRTSVMRYKGSSKSLPEIAEDLHVDAVVEGSVLRVGSRVRITAELIHAATDTHLWGECYERDLQDVLVLQSEVARAIAREIQVAVTAEESKRLASARPVDPEAYEAYLKGRHCWNQRTEEALKKAAEYFRQAIAKNPRYALAYSGLADAYILLGDTSYGYMPPREAMREAKSAAEKALEIDDTLAEAHNSLGAVKDQFDWDLKGAEREFKRAVELDPGYATAHHWYAYLLAHTGRLDEAASEIAIAREFDPVSLIINADVGWVYYLARRYDQAIEQLHKTLELDSNFVRARYLLGRSFLEKGMYAEAVRELRKATDLSGRNAVYVAGLGCAYAASGKRDEATGILRELKERSKRSYIPPCDIALIYVALGEHDEAFRWLEKAFDEGSDFKDELKAGPALDPLRTDPRFRDLLRRVDLTQ